MVYCLRGLSLTTEPYPLDWLGTGTITLSVEDKEDRLWDVWVVVAFGVNCLVGESLALEIDTFSSIVFWKKYSLQICIKIDWLEKNLYNVFSLTW